MTQTNANLNNNFGLGAGITPHYAITYDDSLSTADGQDRANALIGDCEGDFTWMSNLFGNIGIPFSFPVSLQISPGSYASAGWGPPITLTPGNGQPEVLLRYLVVSEVTEMMMDKKANGWGYSFGDSNEGSKGEALSRFLGFQFLSQNSLSTSILNESGGTFFVSNSWLNSPRTDFVNNNPDDNHPDATTGCTTLFVYYLFHQLQFTIPNIIGAGSRFLSGVYTNLTGDPGDPFPFFKRLCDNAFPGTSTITLGPNLDDPFPLGILSFWADQNTFGRDQVQDIINHQGGLVSNAFWLLLEGFSINSFNALNVAITPFTGAFTGLPGITITPTPATPGGPTPPAPIPQFEDPTNLKAPQRIRFSFDITFSNLNAFPTSGNPTVTAELDASANIGGFVVLGTSASTLFELLAGANPYFTNIDPNNQGDAFYLSQDLRVFSIAAGDSPLPGAPAFTSDPYASIQSLIGFLNGNPTFTSFPGSSDPLNALPGQTGFETADSSVFALGPDGVQHFNFAVARVRLRGAPGDQALAVRVFFRLWVAQSFDTDFQPSTTYLSTPGTSGADAGNPIFPLPSGSGLTDPTGQSVQTIPFFATSSSGAHDFDGTITNSNFQNMTIPSSGNEICYYFACYLDVFNASHNSKFGGTHHCIVSQIAYDGAPIPTSTPAGTTPSPANWDQLAQRNLQITTSENPTARATHVIPQAFDMRASPPLIGPPGLPTNLPDEIMVDWGDTPVGSIATFYWPQASADDVIALANQIYSSHFLSKADANTLQCTVTNGVTYIPIPSTAGLNFAGLLTIDLPDTVKRDQTFNIVLRRVTTRQPPPVIDIRTTRAATAEPAPATRRTPKPAPPDPPPAQPSGGITTSPQPPQQPTPPQVQGTWPDRRRLPGSHSGRHQGGHAPTRGGHARRPQMAPGAHVARLSLGPRTEPLCLPRGRSRGWPWRFERKCAAFAQRLPRQGSTPAPPRSPPRGRPHGQGLGDPLRPVWGLPGLQAAHRVRRGTRLPRPRTRSRSLDPPRLGGALADHCRTERARSPLAKGDHPASARPTNLTSVS
ncbi:MAG: hypothetical protein JO111_08330 [Caulobacteraceae bacterium]|nr:hypothetical protein [Caulobacteraceae bacterium]